VELFARLRADLVLAERLGQRQNAARLLRAARSSASCFPALGATAFPRALAIAARCPLKR
jgi:hypothetical protein